jgi:hypothetical protein
VNSRLVSGISDLETKMNNEDRRVQHSENKQNLRQLERNIRSLERLEAKGTISISLAAKLKKYRERAAKLETETSKYLAELRKNAASGQYIYTRLQLLDMGYRNRAIDKLDRIENPDDSLTYLYRISSGDNR